MRLAMLVAAASVATASSTAIAATTPPLRSITLGASGATYKLSYYGNQAIGTSMPGIKRIVVVQHGVNRDAKTTFTDTNAGLLNSGANTSEILLIAPKLYNNTDSVPSGNPYWNSSDWLSGYNALSTPHVSSFTVIDDLLKKINDATVFPNVTQVVMAGHSAGAQMYQRYAAFNDVYETMRPQISLKYAFANAGTYMYFSTDRPTGSAADGATAFSTFTGQASCANYNDYKYGLGNFPASTFTYPHSMTPDALFTRFAGRNASFFQGTADTLNYNESATLDSDCAAVLSGDYRFARGITNIRYERYNAAKLGKALNHTAQRVEGVSHNEGNMWGSVCASTLLFGQAQMLNTTGASCNPLN